MTTISQDERSVVVRFEGYDLDSYEMFIKAKGIPESEIDYEWETDTYTLTAPARFGKLLGVQVPVAERPRHALSPHLFDFQAWIVGRALETKRFAPWIDTGLGKSHIIIEWARQVAAITGGRVPILSPNSIAGQTQEIGREWFGLDIERLTSREALTAWCKGSGPGVGIASHHALVPGVLPELRYAEGVAIDEASILKAGGGTIKWNIIHSTVGIPFKLSATATPAPNDTMEYASQGRFLEKLRSDGEILWTFFSRDKKGKWNVKPHAREAFYRFMASWSIYMRDPARFGFEDILASLPDPDIREYTVPVTADQKHRYDEYRAKSGRGMFTDEDKMGVQERSKLSQMAKGFAYSTTASKRSAEHIDSNKPAFVADLIRQDVRDGRQVLVATVFDEESSILQRELADLGTDVATLDGQMKERDRDTLVADFKHHGRPVLISKATLVGYGLNFQNAGSVVFSGFDDSFERMYQFIRRVQRFGQTKQVRVHIPYVPELEGMMFNNVKQKEEAFLRDVEIQEEHYRNAMGELL